MNILFYKKLPTKPGTYLTMNPDGEVQVVSVREEGCTVKGSGADSVYKEKGLSYNAKWTCGYSIHHPYYKGYLWSKAIYFTTDTED